MVTVVRAVQLWHAAPGGSVFGLDLVLLIAGRAVAQTVCPGDQYRLEWS